MTYTETLFEPNESICAGSRFETGIRPRDSLSPADEFVALNPLHDRRLDANVTCFRNILIESDIMDVSLQRIRMKALGLPYSAAVFSGGKSIHFIICLATALGTRQDYDSVVRRVYKGLESLDFPVDAANKNPSRLTRNPGHLRADKGTYQDLLELQGRVPNDSLYQWLDKYAPMLPPAPPLLPGRNWQRALSGRTLNLLMSGAEAGTRHRACVAAAFDMKDCGLSQEECLRKLSRAPGIELNRSLEDAVAWVYRRSDMRAI